MPKTEIAANSFYFHYCGVNYRGEESLRDYVSGLMQLLNAAINQIIKESTHYT